MVEFKRVVVRALAPSATGVLLDPEIGVAQCIVDGSLPARSGLVVAVEATGYTGPSTARRSAILDGWSVSKAKRIGASAIKLLLYYHPDAANAADQERLLETISRDAIAEDIALFVEPLSFSLDPEQPLRGEARRAVVVETARRLTAIGGNVLKAEFPYDRSVTDANLWRIACAELNAAAAVPWVLLSGGVDATTFESQARIACEAGASGVLVGRSIWAEAATLTGRDREAFLGTEARARLGRLAAIVDTFGLPWESRSPLTMSLQEPADRWYREP